MQFEIDQAAVWSGGGGNVIYHICLRGHRTCLITMWRKNLDQMGALFLEILRIFSLLCCLPPIASI